MLYRVSRGSRRTDGPPPDAAPSADRVVLSEAMHQVMAARSVDLLSALAGTRTPNLLIRRRMSGRPADVDEC